MVELIRCHAKYSNCDPYNKRRSDQRTKTIGAGSIIHTRAPEEIGVCRTLYQAVHSKSVCAVSFFTRHARDRVKTHGAVLLAEAICVRKDVLLNSRITSLACAAARYAEAATESRTVSWRPLYWLATALKVLIESRNCAAFVCSALRSSRVQ